MPLNPNDTKKIQANFKEIVDAINLDSILDSLISKGVLSFDDNEKIGSQATNKEKNREFVKCLIKAPEKGFNVFIEELKKDESYKELGENIEKTEVTEESPDTIERWIGKEGLPQEKTKKQLTDLNMLHFSKAINPHNLSMVAPFFEFSIGDVQCIEYRNVRSPEAACHELLINWKTKLGNKATVESLLDIMFKAWSTSNDSIIENRIQHAINEI